MNTDSSSSSSSSTTGHPRRLLAVTATAALVLVGTLGGVAAPASAAGESVNVIVEQEDGTPDWDALDEDATNGIVRTNDTVAYTISVRSEGGAQRDLSLTFTLPQGQELLSLPSYCEAGSSVTPTSLGALPIPLTSASWLSLQTQTVVCLLPDRAAAPETIDYVFTAKARAEVPSGTTLDPFSATASAIAVSDDAAITDTSNEVEVEVVSAPLYDLGKNGMSSTGDNSGYVAISTTTCTSAAFVDEGFVGCQVLRFPVLISVQPGGKGNSPLTGDITFVDDISPDVFWGAGTTAKPGWDPRLTPVMKSCGAVTGLGNGASFFPYGSGGGTNRVIESGSITCGTESTGAVTVTITGADTTARTYPTTNGTQNVAVPADKAYVISGFIEVEYPTAALQAIGNESQDGSYQLPYVNTYTELTGTDLTGASIPAESNTANNTRRGTAAVTLPGTFNKFFMGEPGNSANAGGSWYAAGNYSGPPGSASLRDGNGIVQPDGRIVSGIATTLNSPPGYGGVTQVICDSWDSSRAWLTATDWQGLNTGAVWPTAGYHQQEGSGGEAVWLAYTSDTATFDYEIEYGTGTPGATAANDCTDSDTGWVSDPATLAGNDPTLAADGIYTAASVVRIILRLDSPLAENRSAQYLFSIGLTVADDAESGDVIGNWSAAKTVRSDQAAAPSAADAVDATSTERIVSSYVPVNHTGNYGDRVTVQAVVARLLKEVRESDGGAFTSTTVPRYASGVPVEFRLTPTVTSGTNTGATTVVVVEDCLPLFQSFVSSIRQDGSPIAPTIITTDGAPIGADLSCPVGQTYLQWELGTVPVNSAISPILYTVHISAAAPNGTYSNTAAVSADGDESTLAQRSSTRSLQIEAPVGLRLDKTAIRPVVEINPADVTAPRTLQWRVDFSAIDTQGVSDVEVIDVLPADGLGGSSFDGTLALSAASVTTSSGTAVLHYTAAPHASIALDPEDPSNLAAGATVWCDAPGGTVVSGDGTAADCPATLAEVTGLRAAQTGAFVANALLTIDVTMVPLGNLGGDEYVNIAQADATGVLQGVGPVERAIVIVESSVGNRVWNDLDHDGIQGPDEPGIADWPVRIVGTDVDGNAVNRTTTTDADGLYEFTGLASGTYDVDFSRSPMPLNAEWTLEHVGADDAVDSDVDPATGHTPEFALGVDSEDPNWDAGVFINLDVELDIEKVAVSASALNLLNQATVVYAVTVTNSGTAIGVYDLDDELAFGGGITVRDVKVANTEPSTIVVDPAFDGMESTRIVSEQQIAGDSVHEYRVTVEVTVTTESTVTSRDCTLTTTETGTGYLNFAVLTVDEVEIEDSDCLPAPVPSTALMAVTGLELPIAVLSTAVLLALAGGLLLIVRRRRAEG